MRGLSIRLPALLALLLIAASGFGEERNFPHVKLNGQFTQGGLVIGTLAPEVERVVWGKKTLALDKNRRFAFGFGRDEASQQQLVVILKNGEHQTITIALAKRDYDIQRVEGVPSRTVNPNPENLTRIRREAGAVSAARNTDSELNGFLQQFIWPLKGPITGVYGSQRFYNGEPRRPHFGIDIAAPEGEKILAPAAGKVTLAYHDMFFSGDTMIIDHGHGVSTSYLHMSKMLVAEGDQVTQGQVIGLVGATGRATGPHLCWRLNWYQTRLDPRLLVPAL